MDLEHYVTAKALVGSMLYTLLGLIVFCLSFVVIDKLTPGNLWKEIIEEKNLAVAVLMGAVAIGISTVIAAAIQG